MKSNRLAGATIGAVVVLSASLTASASHSWNNYHWARTTSSFTLRAIDSVTSD